MTLRQAAWASVSLALTLAYTFLAVTNPAFAGGAALAYVVAVLILAVAP